MPTSEQWPARAPARRGPVFELPPSPDTRYDLVRIVDPAGFAVAWIDPGWARFAGFMVRSPDQDQAGWRSVFALPDALPADAWPRGCALLAAASCSRQRTGADPGDDWPGGEWRLLERDPTSVSLETALRDYGNDGGPNAGAVYGRLTVRLDDATLSLALSVRNEGIVTRPVAFGLHPVLAPGLGNGSFRALLQQGRLCIPLHDPEGVEADGCTRAPNSGVVGTPPARRPGTPDGALRIVVTCDEGVHDFETQIAGGGRLLALAMHGSPPGQPVLLSPGASARLAISVAVLAEEGEHR